jgi:hypothetical protein
MLESCWLLSKRRSCERDYEKLLRMTDADREGMWRTDSYFLSFLSFVRDVGREQPPRRSPRNTRATECTLVWASEVARISLGFLLF